MTATFAINKKGWASAIFLATLFMILLTTQAHAGASDSSITLKKEPGSSVFFLTVKDPDGVQEFSMTPSNKNPYGGILSGCPRSYVNERVVFDDPADFTPVMSAYVIDCGNNTLKLEIAPPKDGLAKSVPVVKKDEAPPAPKPLPPEETKKVEKKVGPLSASDIQYPVRELGGCQSETECRSYCDNSQRAKECFTFAQKYNLITKKEAEQAEKEFFNVKKGPGGCNSGPSCETYCNNVEHLDECIAFAEDSGYYSGDKLAEAKKFQALVKSGKQFPGGCKDRNACEIYCNTPQHMEECLNFAESTGFMPKDEIEQARKILPLMQRGETPGGCTSKEQCEKYCFEDSHSDECIAFGEKAGLISKEDAEMVKKTHGKGPGGCRSKEQCDAYCENNSDECFQWAQDNGFFSEKGLAKMKKGMAQFKEQLDKIPPEVTQCLKDSVGEKNFDKLVQGQPVFDRGMEQKMKACFSQITSQVSKQLNTLPPEAAQCIKDTIGAEGLRKLQSGEFGADVDFSDLEECFQKLQASFRGGSGGPSGPGGPGGPGGFSGPGGCKSIEECTSFCQTNPKECQNFAPPSGTGFPGGGPGGPGGGGFPGGGGPGGCRSQEECQAYCQSHPQECGGGHDGGGGGPTPSPTQSCALLPSGLVSWLDDDTLSGAVGGVTLAPGKVGKALKFRADGGYVKEQNSEVLGKLNFGTGPFSLEAWFMWDGGGSAKGNIIRKSNYPVSGDGAGYWLVINKEKGELEFFVGETVGNAGKARGKTSVPISSGTWHHAVATRNGFGAMSLYVDGELKGTADAAGANTTSNAPFTLGAWDDRFGVTELFSGLIDETSVYNRALDPSEVRAIFNAGSAGKCTNPDQSAPAVPAQYPSYQQQQQFPQIPGGSSYEVPTTPELCAGFNSVPACSYVGPTDSQNYKLCKQCFPAK